MALVTFRRKSRAVFDCPMEHDQQILDARMEYGHLVDRVRTIEQLWWVEASAFFAVNTLLATIYAFSWTTTAQAQNANFLKAVHVLIPLIGVFFAFAAIRVAYGLTRWIRLINERGRELEKTLSAKMFTELQAYSEQTPWGTVLASLLFFVLWVGAMLAGFTSKQELYQSPPSQNRSEANQNWPEQVASPTPTLAPATADQLGPTPRIITNKMREQLIAALAGHSPGRVGIAVENSSSDDQEFGKSLISALTAAGVPTTFVPAIGNRMTNYRTTGIEIAGEEPLLSELIKALSEIDVPTKTTGTHRHDSGEVSNVIITIPKLPRP